MNYDVGILTFWNVPNYGTFAQAYALQKVCESIAAPRNVFQIAYLDKRHFASYYSKIPNARILSLRFWKELPIRLIPFSKYNKKKSMFLESYRKINHTEPLDKTGVKASSFDTLILGSDIVWDYSFEVFNHDELLFGNGIKARKKIAYACSFGTIRVDNPVEGYACEGLHQIDRISVRDSNSQKIVEKITGTSPMLVLDPTWLWNFSEDENLIKPAIENYIVVYGQDFTEEFIKEIIKYANKHALKIVCLDCNNDNYDWCDVIVRQYELDPFMWMGYFKYANAIATSTFHGLTFGLIFNKKLAFCKSDFILAKAGDFLKQIGLYDIYVKSPNYVFDQIDKGLDYTRVNEYIDLERRKSLAFLKESLVK